MRQGHVPVWLLLCAVFGAALPARGRDSDGETAKSAAAPRVLQIAAEEYPPFHYAQGGVATGACVEVIGRILGKLKIPYAFSFYPFTRSWMLLEKGKADAAPSISHKPERESVFHFTPEQKQFDATGVVPPDYLWMTEYVFFVNRRVASSFRFESYEQIKADGYRIGVNTRYTYDPAFLAAGLNTVKFVDPAESLRALAEGRIDLYPLDRTVRDQVLPVVAGLAHGAEGRGRRRAVGFLQRGAGALPVLHGSAKGLFGDRQTAS